MIASRKRARRASGNSFSLFSNGIYIYLLFKAGNISHCWHGSQNCRYFPVFAAPFTTRMPM